MKAVLYADGKPQEAAIPGDLAEQAKEYRDKLSESAAESDDALLAKYLEEGSIGEAEMLKALRAAVATGKVIPVLAAAATKSIGSHPLLDLIVESFPSPRWPRLSSRG